MTPSPVSRIETTSRNSSSRRSVSSPQTFAAALPKSGTASGRNLPPDDRQDQHGFLQIAALQLAAPGPVDIGGKALAVDGFQLGLGRAHHPVQIEAETLIQRVEEMREPGPQGGDRRRPGCDPVNAGHLERDHQPVVAGAHHLVIKFDDIRQMRIDLRVSRDQRPRPAPQPFPLKKHDAALSEGWPSASPAS